MLPVKKGSVLTGVEFLLVRVAVGVPRLGLAVPSEASVCCCLLAGLPGLVLVAAGVESLSLRRLNRPLRLFFVFDWLSRLCAPAGDLVMFVGVSAAAVGIFDLVC